MNKHMMFHLMWCKAKYGFKSYAFFVIVTILLIGLYIFGLCTFDLEEAHRMENIFIMVFVYVPASIVQAMQAIEYSKCYYLVPRTKEERKQYLILQNIVKVILAFSINTLLLILGAIIRREVFAQILTWYLICGVSLIIITGASGFTTYCFNKKKKSYRRYITDYIITMIVIIAIYFGAVYFKVDTNVKYGLLASTFCIGASASYTLYYWCRFRGVDVSYENIDKNEQQFMTRFRSPIM